ncbi:hypothetical protein H4J56_18880 [Colwellia sp. BRX8-4]|uniref:DUF6896 domain-containing protein n=1 Tax=Colwellia sp. BRX8-4 TaxID=2759836 RepID=UPI0015F6504D|nr:hypothetical protein [Colwellia sp. BRX8-4]MBA6362404.1 hypothetical protein [Colwellia sp. BRX8-8]MBA6373482.1 hypothetical protein [Colwellia sp. BRX8-4]
MNSELRKIISDFQNKVEEANELLKKFLDTDKPHNWGVSIEQVGMLGGKHKYFFHGVGCKVEISKKNVVDFDYGSNGRIDGFDEWRLCGFVNTRKKQYPNVQESHIKQWFQEAIEAKEIKKADSREYGNLYYLVANT